MSDQNPLLVLLELARRARKASSPQELAFLLVNDSRYLAPYRQAALWLAPDSIRCLSGVVQPEANAPYTQWLGRLCSHLHAADAPDAGIRQLSAQDLTPSGQLAESDIAEWVEWLPQHALWLPFAGEAAGIAEDGGGGLLMGADEPWTPEALAMLKEWMEIWQHAWRMFAPRPGWSVQRLRREVGAWLKPMPGQPWWRQRRSQVALLVSALLLCPVRLTVLAHAELVPANPAVMRAPIDGVVGQFHVAPNQLVRTGQLLFGFDEAPIAARLEVARQALATAEAEYRQMVQLALNDGKSKAQLSSLQGKVDEKRAEAEFLQGQLDRSRVIAPQDGIAIFDDPSEWVGKPVQTGERIMRITAPGDVEVEAWVALADAIPIETNALVSLYLAASPLHALSARVRYLAHDAVLRPDGSYAYRLRARIEGDTSQRPGLKGTAKVSGEWVPLVYWVLRRPLAVVRQTLGV